MNEQEFEDFAKQWPELFQKAGDFELSVGPGWSNILNTLFGMLSYKVTTAKNSLKYALETPNAKFVKTIPELEAEFQKELDNLPTMVQVKEKFGTLRFYVDGGTLEMHNYIEFAEAMTAVTCEVCGNPGKSRSGGWIRVLCNEHARKEDEAEEISVLSNSKPILFDD